MSYVIGLGLMIGAGWFWFDSLRAREIAMELCRHTCRHFQLQLLDDTVRIEHIKIRRRTSGNLYLQRSFKFEFTDTGETRIQGVVMMNANIPVFIDLPGYYEKVINAAA
ncbi:MAG: DUF3301 domain-containing protein [Pseudomonadota bacterium]